MARGQLNCSFIRNLSVQGVQQGYTATPPNFNYRRWRWGAALATAKFIAVPEQPSVVNRNLDSDPTQVLPIYIARGESSCQPAAKLEGLSSSTRSKWLR